MKPGVLSAEWSETFASICVVFATARLTSGAADNPIAVELHRMGKSPQSSCFTGVPRLPR
jgi:hypothetical protein